MLGKKSRAHLIQLAEPLPDTKVGDRVGLCGAEVPRARLVAIFDDLPIGPGAKLVDPSSGLMCTECLMKAGNERYVYGIRREQDEAAETQ